MLARCGETLGGDDIDMLILRKLVGGSYGEERLKQKLGIRNWDEIANSAVGWRLLERVEQRKRDLSDLPSVRLGFYEGGLDLKVELTRAALQKHMGPELDRIERLVRQTLASADQGRRPMKPRGLDVVILAGGSSLIPAVHHGRKEVAVIIPAGTPYRKTVIDMAARKGISERFNPTNSASEHLVFEVRAVNGNDKQGRLLHTVHVPISTLHRRTGSASLLTW